jgi:hypothetical protein
MYQSNMPRIPSCNATVGNNKDSISLSGFLKSMFSRIHVKTIPKSPVPWPKTPEPPSRPIQPNPFNKLPFEIGLDILDRLPLLSAASLACTCRYMHEGFGPKYYTHLNPPQNISAKIELLTCLDPSLPMHRLCNVCAIFHRQLSAKEAQEAVRNNHEGTWGSCPDAPRRIPVGKGYSLPWRAIKSVIRAYRYGAEYGIPLDTLAQHWESGNGWDNRSEASIVDGKLLVKVMNVRAVDESASNLFYCLNKLRFKYTIL